MKVNRYDFHYTWKTKDEMGFIEAGPYKASTLDDAIEIAKKLYKKRPKPYYEVSVRRYIFDDDNCQTIRTCGYLDLKTILGIKSLEA